MYDFRLDGLLILRVGDITEVKCSLTDVFQKRLLEDEGLIDKVPFGASFKTGKTELRIRYFSGAGNWSEQHERLKYEDLTSCQVDTNYINVYHRHSERSASRG